VATRLRTASTERVRKATRGRDRQRGQQAPVLLLDLVDHQHDQRLAGESSSVIVSALGQRMAERQPQPVGRDSQRLGPAAPAGRGGRGHHHRHVELAPDQQVLEIVAVVLDRRDLDRGKARR
jgi:hypothetical protein